MCGNPHTLEEKGGCTAESIFNYRAILWAMLHNLGVGNHAFRDNMKQSRWLEKKSQKKASKLCPVTHLPLSAKGDRYIHTCIMSYLSGITEVLKDKCFGASLLLDRKSRKLTLSSSSKVQCLISHPNPKSIFIDQTD